MFIFLQQSQHVHNSYTHAVIVVEMYGVLSNAALTRMLCWQERLAKAHGSQCGFCTPGVVMSVYTLLRNKPQPSMDDITQALAGVLDQFFLQSHSITSYFSC